MVLNKAIVGHDAVMQAADPPIIENFTRKSGRELIAAAQSDHVAF